MESAVDRPLKAAQSLFGGVSLGYGLALVVAGSTDALAIVALLIGLLGVLEGLFPKF